jgi:hypothetical protein
MWLSYVWLAVGFDSPLVVHVCWPTHKFKYNKDLFGFGFFKFLRATPMEVAFSAYVDF